MSEDQRPLERVVLAISTFRFEESVIALLETACDGDRQRFGQVIVVDSLGDGEIAKAIEKRNWPVRYVNADRNLGSAGNLDLRLSLAAETGLDWCCALNHDGALDQEKVIELLRCGSSDRTVGAIYPRLRFTAINGQLDSPRRRFNPFGQFEENAPADQIDLVKWSSSNGALYNLDAIRAGLDRWPELWMGYEDLAIGWELDRRGLKQLRCNDVIVDDNYEYRSVRLFSRTIILADKPAWFSYYHIRNLALIARKSRGQAVTWGGVIKRFAVDIALLPCRRSPVRRAAALVRGLVAGIRGKDGKGRMP